MRILTRASSPAAPVYVSTLYFSKATLSREDWSVVVIKNMCLYYGELQSLDSAVINSSWGDNVKTITITLQLEMSFQCKNEMDASDDSVDSVD